MHRQQRRRREQNEGNLTHRAETYLRHIPNTLQNAKNAQRHPQTTHCVSVLPRHLEELGAPRFAKAVRLRRI